MSSANRAVLTTSKPRLSLSNHSTNNSTMFQNTRQKTTANFTAMSPEASRALAMTKEEAKENISNNNYPQGSLANGAKYTMDMKEKSNMSGRKISGARNQNKGRPPPRYNRADTGVMPQRSTIPQNTARSRSTLSHNEAPQSVSDRGSYARNFQNSNTNSKPPKPPHIPSSLSINNTSSISNVDRNNNEEDEEEANYSSAARSRGDGFEDDLDAMELNSNGDNDAEDSSDKVMSQSFVLTLDRTLEEHGISRLRGDITDQASITAPGTVRALNGGRLTNAQEVVVNVCHDDERELVFHDDDEESLDTAKTVSNIRINVWMEYNNNFDPDNTTDDLDIGVNAASDTKNNNDVTYNSASASGNPKDKPSKTPSRIQTNKKAPLPKNMNSSSNSNKLSTNSGTATSRATARGREAATARRGSGLSEVQSRASSSSSRQKQAITQRKAKT